MTFLRHLISFLILPFTVAGVIPYILLRRGAGDPSTAARAIGIAVLAMGLILVMRTIALFASLGRGTLAPWDPPRHLVVRGIYRHVRNPMITGVLLTLIGESLLFRSTAVGIWAAVVFVINAVYIPLLEEPDLRRRFGPDYEEYSRHVPRWLPRISGWSPVSTPARHEPRA